jgi:hypothetical protein
MAITLDGTLGITFPSGSVQNNAVANNAAITALVGSRGLAQSIVPAGSVLQTIYINYNTNSSYATSASFVDTGLTASITPTSATSKILILVSINGISTISVSTQDTLALTLTDGSNNNITGLGGANIPGYGQAPYYTQPLIYVHSPATTSTLTYKVRGRSAALTWQINNYNISIPNPNSSIILMEIAQ